MNASDDSDGCLKLLESCFPRETPATASVLGNLQPMMPRRANSINQQGLELRQLNLESVGALIITDALDSEGADQVTKTLAALRNRLIPNIVWMCPASRARGFESAMLAIGFSVAGEFGNRVAYRYAMSDEDSVRDWNNADDWARPENFRRHRW